METTVVEKFDSGLHPRFSRLAAYFATRVLGFACSNFAKKIRIAKKIRHSDFSFPFIQNGKFHFRWATKPRK